jgi:hypothetical protein
MRTVQAVQAVQTAFAKFAKPHSGDEHVKLRTPPLDKLANACYTV